MNFPAITITDSTPFTLRLADTQFLGRIKTLEISVNSPGAAVYYGDIPGLPVSISDHTSVASTLVPKNNQSGWNSVVPGMVFSAIDDASDDGKYVVANEPNAIVMNATMAASLSLATIVFTPPAISSTNGIPIPAGTSKSFLADELNYHLDSGLTFVVASGLTATMRLRYRFGR